MAIELPRRRPPSELLPSKSALRLIAAFEGLSLKSYPDPATGGDPWTAGYGHTGPDVKPGMMITLKQADDWLAEDMEEAAGIVRSNVLVPLTPGEFDALCSLAFNLGYIPRSLKAALNGGTSDKGEVFPPGSYGSALKQFPRNCRAAGVPMRGLLRRRLAECCVYSDLPWEAACSINLVRLKCDAKGNIDPVETTSLEDTLERARQDVPMGRPPIDVTKPWPMPSAPARDVAPAPLPDSPPPTLKDALDGIPTQLPVPGAIEDEDELFLENEAAAPETDAKGAAPSPATQPEVARAPQPDSNPANKDQPRVSAEAAPATAPPSPPAPPVPLPPKLPDPPIPVGQQTSAVDAARKSEDWSESAKAMWKSRRFWGLVLVMGGRLWMLKTGSNAVLGAVSDPLVTEMFSGFMVMLIGEVVQHWGERKATRPLR